MRHHAQLDLRVVGADQHAARARPRTRGGSRGPAPCASGCSADWDRSTTSRPVAAPAWSNVVCTRPSRGSTASGQRVEVGGLELGERAVLEQPRRERMELGQLLEHLGVGRDTRSWSSRPPGSPSFSNRSFASCGPLLRLMRLAGQRVQLALEPRDLARRLRRTSREHAPRRVATPARSMSTSTRDQRVLEPRRRASTARAPRAARAAPRRAGTARPRAPRARRGQLATGSATRRRAHAARCRRLERRAPTPEHVARPARRASGRAPGRTGTSRAARRTRAPRAPDPPGGQHVQRALQVVRHLGARRDRRAPAPSQRAQLARASGWDRSRARAARSSGAVARRERQPDQRRGARRRRRPRPAAARARAARARAPRARARPRARSQARRRRTGRARPAAGGRCARWSPAQPARARASAGGGAVARAAAISLGPARPAPSHRPRGARRRRARCSAAVPRALGRPRGAGAPASASATPSFVRHRLQPLAPPSASRSASSSSRRIGATARSSSVSPRSRSARTVTSSRDRKASSRCSMQLLAQRRLLHLVEALVERVERAERAACSSTAVFSPTPGTPGMLSEVSPISASTSRICSGPTPHFSRTPSASIRSVVLAARLRRQHRDRVADQLQHVLVAGDQQRPRSPPRRPARASVAITSSASMPGFSITGSPSASARGPRSAGSARQLVRHRLARRLVVGVQLVPERRARAVPRQRPAVGLLLAPQLEHRVRRSRRCAEVFSPRQFAQRAADEARSRPGRRGRARRARRAAASDALRPSGRRQTSSLLRAASRPRPSASSARSAASSSPGSAVEEPERAQLRG